VTRIRPTLTPLLLLVSTLVPAIGADAPGPVKQPPTSPVSVAADKSDVAKSNNTNTGKINALRIGVSAIASGPTNVPSMTLRVWSGRRLYVEKTISSRTSWLAALRDGVPLPLSRLLPETDLDQVTLEIVLPMKHEDRDWLSEFSVIAIATDNVESIMFGEISVAGEGSVNDANNTYVIQKKLIKLPEYPTDATPGVGRIGLRVHNPSARLHDLHVLVIQDRRAIARHAITADWELEAVTSETGVPIVLDRKLTEGVTSLFGLCIFGNLVGDHSITSWNATVDATGVADDGVTCQLVSSSPGMLVSDWLTQTSAATTKLTEQIKSAQDCKRVLDIKKANLAKDIQTAPTGEDIVAKQEELAAVTKSITDLTDRIVALDGQVEMLKKRVSAIEQVERSLNADARLSVRFWPFNVVTP
jgi:hypothetical protein